MKKTWYWFIGPWTITVIGVFCCMLINSYMPAFAILIGYTIGYIDKAVTDHNS